MKPKSRFPRKFAILCLFALPLISLADPRDPPGVNGGVRDGGGSGGPASQGNSVTIQPSARSDEGGLDLVLSGPKGSAAEEIYQYFFKGGVCKKSPESNGSFSCDEKSMWGWKVSVPGEHYAAFFSVHPNEMKNLQLNLGSTSSFSVTVPDAASVSLYRLMGKFGITADPNDRSKKLQGKFVTCWAYHGYPSGPFFPTCTVSFGVGLSGVVQ